METTYKTIIVTFKESIDRLNGTFDAPHVWGASTLKEWVDAYESSRLVQIGKNTVVITSEYNMPSIVEWLQRYTPIEILQED